MVNKTFVPTKCYIYSSTDNLYLKENYYTCKSIRILTKNFNELHNDKNYDKGIIRK
jgi:hypothetical protein